MCNKVDINGKLSASGNFGKPLCNSFVLKDATMVWFVYLKFLLEDSTRHKLIIPLLIIYKDEFGCTSIFKIECLLYNQIQLQFIMYYTTFFFVKKNYIRLQLQIVPIRSVLHVTSSYIPALCSVVAEQMKK
jgi:hypothetical protein